jgi:hypothetical protein
MPMSEGPPGLDAVHTWRGIDLGLREADVWTKLTKLTGYYSLPDADDNRGPRSGRRGEVVYPGEERGKTVVYEGEVRAKTLSALRTKATNMRAAFRKRRQEYQMDITADGGVTPWHFNARVIQFDMDDEQTNGLEAVWPWKRPFSIGLRLGDPRFYYSDSEDFKTAAYASGSSHNLTNQGTVDTEPVFYIDRSAATDPGDITLENLTDPDNERILVWRNVPVTHFRVNFFLRRAHQDDGTGTLRYLDESASTWWDEGKEGMDPGLNTFRITSDDSTWGVEFWHAFE